MAGGGGKLAPGGVSLKRTSGAVRSMMRMFIRARRGEGVGAPQPKHRNDGYSTVRLTWRMPGKGWVSQVTSVGLQTSSAACIVEPPAQTIAAAARNTRIARLDITPP